MTLEEAKAREADFPRAIRELSLRNVLVARIVSAYIGGDICTIEEALCQMIVGLTRNWEEHQKRYYEAAMAIRLTEVKPIKPI